MTSDTPTAPRRPHAWTRPTGKVEDPYAWLLQKDDSETLTYLAEENSFCNQWFTNHTKEIEEICKCCKTSEHAVALLIAESNQVVDKARQQLLAQQPQLILPGGKLHPEPRAEACWRDCQQFLRVIIYGVACDCTEVTDAAGMTALRQLYKEMEVPIPAMMYVLAQMRTLTTQLLKTSGHFREATCLDKAFDNLIKALQPT